ncbi:RiPP maturation radical SAM C-methyltransferase [Comamonas sp. JC664]|uniref:RiPP maturation radical SAM C-methyltransferase n=1 Tax=Comamonas sp. JC664 TaxID=2801917 RepID=UPI00174C39C6|nr:RiPP maturation radical SAM C-methyltransferase [Comamonas sp. JC664]MBL0693188.1 RiPP maturation radical SAM C-methyltransferase [Comamonas sp. JC664]GHG97259.1 RiPP maturation radical SAM protein 1 [Comamonas sp. KCTC 72670]
MDTTPTVPDLSDLAPADALLILPPFAGFSYGGLGVHLLQACAREAGLEARVLYANLHLAGEVGQRTYVDMACDYACTPELFGERFFARAAFDRPALALPEDGSQDERFTGAIAQFGMRLDLARMRELEARAYDWADRMGQAIARCGFPVVGASTTFEQTAAAIALLRAVKRHRPETVTLLGGANCEGEMAQGLASTGAPVDYIFSGESEAAFVELLRELRAGRRPEPRIITSAMRRDMDALPRPRYEEYYAQRERLLKNLGDPAQETYVLYETSRGCWWGELHHCTFCGLNGLGMKFREKSPERVLTDLKALLDDHPTKRVWLTDNIMPTSYFRTLLPRLAEELPGVELFYEEKANLSLDKVMLLRAAGVTHIQPGIEALSTPLLKRMNKGVSAAQNIAMLRYTRAAGVTNSWNLLYAFPGDSAQEYEDVLALMPALRHLNPPQGLGRLRVDRFSPYYDKASEHGVRNLQPFAAYADVFPPGTDLSKVAYYFTADYDTGLEGRKDLVQRLSDEVGRWRDAWDKGTREGPALAVRRARPGLFILVDTRGLGLGPEVTFLDEEKATTVLVGPPGNARAGLEDARVAWAVSHKYGAMVEGRYVPLATASPELLKEFEGEARRISRGLPLPTAGQGA